MFRAVLPLVSNLFIVRTLFLSMVSELLSTGIAGLDELLKGGIRKTNSVLVAGVPGSGKTVFGMHYILEGTKHGEPGLFISYEESEESILEYAESFGMDFRGLMQKGLVTVLSIPLVGKMITFAPIVDMIRKNKIQRVFLDSITLFEFVDSMSAMSFRREIIEFIKIMKDMGVTLFASSEKKIANIDVIEYGSQDFLFQGLILLTKVRKGASFERCICISKMRGQAHQLGIYPFAIDEQGVQVYPKQLPFSLIEQGEF